MSRSRARRRRCRACRARPFGNFVPLARPPSRSRADRLATVKPKTLPTRWKLGLPPGGSPVTCDAPKSPSDRTEHVQEVERVAGARHEAVDEGELERPGERRVRPSPARTSNCGSGPDLDAELPGRRLHVLAVDRERARRAARLDGAVVHGLRRDDRPLALERAAGPDRERSPTVTSPSGQSASRPVVHPAPRRRGCG